MDTDTAAADQAHRDWLWRSLGEAAEQLDVTVEGEPVWGWHDRSVSAKVTTREGAAWLRVVSEMTDWLHLDFWTGNETADLPGVAKPRLRRHLEWVEGARGVKAELMDLALYQRLSTTPELHEHIDPRGAWWLDLRDSLAAVRKSGTETERIAVDEDAVRTRLLAFWGLEVDIERWEPAHADLHWANLHGPDLAIVDWEGWGYAPYGWDEATLYLHSLLVPDVASKVHEVFAEVLDSRAGLVAQLAVTAKLLERVLGGDYPDLAKPLHYNATGVLGQIAFATEDRQATQSHLK